VPDGAGNLRVQWVDEKQQDLSVPLITAGCQPAHPMSWEPV
jgi:hypothetical protein